LSKPRRALKNYFKKEEQEKKKGGGRRKLEEMSPTYFEV
jgi:hypothetical protein